MRGENNEIKSIKRAIIDIAVNNKGKYCEKINDVVKKEFVNACFQSGIGDKY